MVFCLIVVLSGCGSSSPAIGVTSSPAEANHHLGGKKARIELSNGQVLTNMRDVYITDQQVSYREGRRGEMRSLPTSEVERVSVLVNTGRGRGATIGMVPGLVYAGIGAVTLMTNKNSAVGLLAGGTVMVTGILGVGVGAVVGMLIGDAATQDVYQVVYVSSDSDDGVDRKEAR